jgi:hypothetical protein
MFYRRQRRIPINLKNILFYVLIPGVCIWYFIASEQTFLDNFRSEFTLLGPGEYIFIFFHSMLIYYLAPILWILNFFFFFKIWFARSIGYELQIELVSLLANFSYTILCIMMLARLLVE